MLVQPKAKSVERRVGYEAVVQLFVSVTRHQVDADRVRFPRMAMLLVKIAVDAGDETPGIKLGVPFA
jgi:hypothetical protein